MKKTIKISYRQLKKIVSESRQMKQILRKSSSRRPLREMKGPDEYDEIERYSSIEELPFDPKLDIKDMIESNDWDITGLTPIKFSIPHDEYDDEDDYEPMGYDQYGLVDDQGMMHYFWDGDDGWNEI